MQVLILAAGQSKRFWPLGDKNFFTFNQKLLIERQIQTLKNAGLKKFIIVGNKKNLPRLQQIFSQAKFVEQKKLNQGMAGAVLSAEKYLNQPTLIVSTNDLFQSTEVKKVLQMPNCDGAILAQKIDQYFPGGYLVLEKNSPKILQIQEKPNPKKIPSQLINLVCHFFREPQKLIFHLKKIKNNRDAGYELALNKLLQTEKFFSVENTKKWQAIKFPWHILNLTENFLQNLKPKIARKTKIAKTAIIKNSIIEDGAQIFDFSIIQNSVISKNSIIGNHTLVRESMIGKNSVIGAGSEVARSFLAENVWLHRNYIGDSIITENISFGAGAVCANLRLDKKEITVKIEQKKFSTGYTKFGAVIGKNCLIGVNANVMPGVLIGQNCFIGSGVIVNENLAEQKFCFDNTKNQILTNKVIQQKD